MEMGTAKQSPVYAALQIVSSSPLSRTWQQLKMLLRFYLRAYQIVLYGLMLLIQQALSYQDQVFLNGEINLELEII